MPYYRSWSCFVYPTSTKYISIENAQINFKAIIAGRLALRIKPVPGLVSGTTSSIVFQLPGE